MEFLTNSLQEVISKLNENQKDEIDIIESIVAINKENRKSTREKLFLFLDKRGQENTINFIVGCIEHAAKIRPKERLMLFFLLTSILCHFRICIETINMDYIVRRMLKVEFDIFDDDYTVNHVFDFAEGGTIERAIFEDNIELLQELLTILPSEKADKKIDIRGFIGYDIILKKVEVNRIELAALFGSIKCFKYLMMYGDEINKETCMYAVAGGNIEIIHLCEQKGLIFEDCLIIAATYHRFEIFEWLNIHFNYEEICLTEFIKFYNEPLFYFYSLSGSDADTKDSYERTPINNASNEGLLEVVKYLYEQCHANVETGDSYGDTPINNASENGHLEVVKYLYETCHANVETENIDGFTPISHASFNGHLEVVKYLYETCHANIETKNEGELTPINSASLNGYLEVVKYLYETCHANVETEDASASTPINNASEDGHLEVVKYLYETCHANVETKDEFEHTPINIASKNGHLDVVKYLYETCHAKVGNSIINASRNGHLEVVKYLYEVCHADAEAKDEDGNTPISNASRNGHLEVVKYLYEVCHAKEGNAISNASRNGHLEVVKYLKETCHADAETKCE